MCTVLCIQCRHCIWKPQDWERSRLCPETQSRQSARLFLKSSEMGLPQPLTHRRVCPPGSGGGAYSLAREGLGESQFRRGDLLYTVVLFIYTYLVPRDLNEEIVRSWIRLLIYNRTACLLLAQYISLGLFFDPPPSVDILKSKVKADSGVGTVSSTYSTHLRGWIE